jgi:glycosyltransferase involved in cell wall biosynthesis
MNVAAPERNENDTLVPDEQAPQTATKAALIVTPYFAPQTHAAVFRAYKLAKYLPLFGWKPYVVTVDTNYLYNEDPSLTEALPPEAEVYTARYIEPSLRGLRMALGGRDRRFVAMKQSAVVRNGAASNGNGAKHFGLPHALYQYLLERWMQVPDAHWTWRKPAVRVATRLIREKAISVVFTSANPFTCHRIGQELKLLGCRWVADLRDPHTYCAHMSSKHPAVFQRQRKAERQAVLNADAITVASSAIGMILTDTYGLRSADRLHFIPTGLDESLLQPASANNHVGSPYLLFVGEFLPEYGSEFLEVFSHALRRTEVRNGHWKLVFAGRREINEPLVRPIAKSAGIEEHVEFIDHLPQQQLYRLLAGAAAGVLLSGRLSLWWCLYAKMVDYIALKKPVIALVPDPSEARTRLREARLGIFLDGDVDECADTLADFLLGRARPLDPDDRVCQRYTARQQVASFARVFDQVL